MPSRMHPRITSAERAQAVPSRGLRLLVPERARHVVHDLELADAAAIDLRHALELALHEVAALDGADEDGPTGSLGGGETGGGEHSSEPVRGNEERVHEVQPARRADGSSPGRGHAGPPRGERGPPERA